MFLENVNAYGATILRRVFPRRRLSPSLMIFLAAMADDRWMGSMKMLAASEPEMAENLDSEAMEKLTGAERRKTEPVRRWMCVDLTSQRS